MLRILRVGRISIGQRRYPAIRSALASNYMIIMRTVGIIYVKTFSYI